VVHQDVEHDIFAHAAGEIGDCDPDQRHRRQGGVHHQRIDAGAEIEDDAQIGEGGELARDRLPDGGVVNLRCFSARIGHQDHTAVAADLVESCLPPVRRPVVRTAMHDDRQRALVHSDVLLQRDLHHIAE
jgi:hypothetical protein